MTLTFIPVSQELPNAEPLETCNTYYMVYVPNYGYFRAMYVFDKTGEKGWYTSYITKIVEPVYAWAHLSD